MGTDCTVVIERCEGGKWWESIGMFHLPRCYGLFDELNHEGVRGYPNDIDHLSKQVLNTVEDWGEGYMDYITFRKLLKKYDLTDMDIIKKKHRHLCRVIYRFDN